MSDITIAKYKIHPAIGIARLGNSPTDFYISPETTGGLPIACDASGNTTKDSSGHEKTVSSFKDAHGLIKRQAARFRIYVYDDKHPEGRELKIGDEIIGNATRGKLVDVKWTAYLANKKSAWYQFRELEGENGYAPDHPLRNADVTQNQKRQNLITDPGPQSVYGFAANGKTSAAFTRGQNPGYAQTFPPTGLLPNEVDSLGAVMTNVDPNKHPRLLVLGGFGNSGSTRPPVIENYVNNDGWFDDISDGPVTATLIYYSEDDQKNMSVEVSDPSWVIVGYPRYAPQITDMITMDDLITDLNVQQFGTNPYLYGTAPFNTATPVDCSDASALNTWRRRAKQYNPDYYPYFFRDIWPILQRPYYMQFTTAVLGISNAAHDTGPQGDFFVDWMAAPPDKETGADPFKARRQFVFGMLREEGEENLYYNHHVPEGTAMYNKPLMPLLCGDNPLSNTLPSKFLRLTDTQLFMLKQWAIGKFINEKSEDFKDDQAKLPVRKGEELDRGVLSNALGGAFCPGAETCWIMRNPAIYSSPYRINQNPAFLGLIFNMPVLSLMPKMSDGLEPGDITKYSGVPWQSDFNECSFNMTDITFEDWNELYPESVGNTLLPQMQQDQYVLWWPSHRPMQVYVPKEQRSDPKNPKKVTYSYTQAQWSRGIQQTQAGDLKMVTEWSKLGFLIRNSDPKSGILYVETEYTGDVNVDWSI